LHCHKSPEDCEEEVKEQDEESKKTVSFVETTEENKSGCTPQEIKRAKAAREFYHKIGTPTLENVKRLMRANSIGNNPVTEQDMVVAEDIFGEDLSCLKGKTTRRTPKATVNDTITVPRELRNRKDVVLHVDAISTNGMPFLASIGCPITFRMCSSVQGTTHEEHHKVLDRALQKCNKAGFRIKEISCDSECRGMLERVQDELDIVMNFANAQDHEPKAERNNRTTKEAFRTAFHRTPHSRMPRLMMQELAELTTERSNCFPAKHGMSKCCSPHVIVNQEPVD